MAWPPTLEETHVSVVVGYDDLVLKLKKPVTTSFLDWSTIERRRDACEREVRLNRRLAPDVYLGVGELRLPGEAPPEPLVVMRRMPDSRRLSALLDAPDATFHLRSVARKMAEFHAVASRSPEISQAGDPAHVRSLWLGNFAQIERFVASPLDPLTVAEVEGLALRYLDGRAALLERRISEGRIVDGHGDLLADDIWCLDDGPRLLDCLEFDERFRYGDVLLDVAFLAMDLERLGHPSLAREFLAAYREFSAENHPASLEQHYLAYRALVRAKVACLRDEQGDVASGSAAARLLELCASHLERATCRLILVGGLPGTGKTTLASMLAERYGWVLLQSDELRKERCGLAGRPAPAPYREGIYDAATTEATYAEMLERAAIALSLGESVVLDASWIDRRQRARAARLARDAYADLSELLTVAPMAVAADRMTARAVSRLDASDADADIAAAMRVACDPWPRARQIDTSGSLDEALDRALAALRLSDHSL